MKRLRNDFLLIGGLLLLILGLFLIWYFLGRNIGSKAVVYRNDVIVAELDLSKKQKITVEGKESKVVIEVAYGSVFVSESGCENQICVHMGKKNHENETITCLPNEIYIVVVGGR